MTDSKLRELERDDPRGWLLGRLRAGDPYRFGSIETACLPVYEACEAIRAAGRSGVLLLAEHDSGSRQLAEVSNRVLFGATAPFVHENCYAVSGSLLEAELVGRIRGGFHATPGLICSSQGGTLYLDEAEHLNEEVQGLLQQLIEEGTYPAPNSEWATIADVHLEARPLRVVLSARTAKGLRSSLRGALTPIQVPPLRDRPEDLELLAARVAGRPVLAPRAVWEQLRAHDWPGNFRELRGVVQALGKGDVTPSRVRDLLRRGNWPAAGESY